MDNGQGYLTELCAIIRGRDPTSFVRAVVKEENGQWVASYLDVVVGPPTAPSGWQAQVWEYEEVTFITAQVPSQELATALDSNDSQALILGQYMVVIPSLSDQLSWQRKPSRARYDSLALVWPTCIYQVSQVGRPERLNKAGFMIGDACPSFPSFDTAFRAFFYNDFTASHPGQVPSEFATIRVVTGAAWLNKVFVSPTFLDVFIEGSDVTGTRIELNGITYRTDVQVQESGKVRLPLPEGLPQGAWLYLSRGRHWLDYRAIGEYRSHAELMRAGVEVELPEDPDSEMQALLSQGEGQRIEFKRQLPGDSDESKRTVFKTVAAFANGGGGSIVFGVEKDEATVCGLDGIAPLKERDRLTQLARSIVTPTPDIQVRQYERDGKILLVLLVEPGINPPYGITLPGKQNKPVEFYVRRDATTFPASPDEIRNAVLATAQLPASSQSWLSHL